MLNFEPLLVPRYETGDNDVNNLESAIAKGVFIVISQSVVL